MVQEMRILPGRTRRRKDPEGEVLTQHKNRKILPKVQQCAQHTGTVPLGHMDPATEASDGVTCLSGSRLWVEESHSLVFELSTGRELT